MHCCLCWWMMMHPPTTKIVVARDAWCPPPQSDTRHFQRVPWPTERRMNDDDYDDCPHKPPPAAIRPRRWDTAPASGPIKMCYYYCCYCCHHPWQYLLEVGAHARPNNATPHGVAGAMIAAKIVVAAFKACCCCVVWCGVVWCGMV